MTSTAQQPSIQRPPGMAAFVRVVALRCIYRLLIDTHLIWDLAND